MMMAPTASTTVMTRVMSATMIAMSALSNVVLLCLGDGRAEVRNRQRRKRIVIVRPCPRSPAEWADTSGFFRCRYEM
jgi:hypothetical protein